MDLKNEKKKQKQKQKQKQKKTRKPWGLRTATA